MYRDVERAPVQLRGRDQFHRWRRLLFVASDIAAWLPWRVRQAIWTATWSWSGLIGIAIRYMILRGRADACGDVVRMSHGVTIVGMHRLRLGSHVSIHAGCYVDATGGISIGDNVSIAHGTSILSSGHTWDEVDIPIRDNPLHLLETVICDDVWVGCGARILGGVRIGSRSVVAAGAVVTRDVPAGVVVAGVPARIRKRLL